MKSLSKRKKITIISIVSILLVIVAILFAIKVNKPEELQEEVVSKVDIQDDNASLNDIVLALDGEVIKDEEDVDTTVFKAEQHEVIVTVGSEVALVNGEEKLLKTVIATDEEPVVSTEDNVQEEQDANIELETKKEEVKQEGAYIYEDEVFVPIEFIEDVFDLEFNDETLEFVKDGEVIVSGEKVEELPVVDEKEDVAIDTEEEVDSEVDDPKEAEKEESKEEEKTEDTKEEEKNETVNSGTSSNGSNTGTSGSGSKPTQQPKPENSTNNSGSSNSTNNSGSNNSSSNNSNNQTKPETSTPAPAPKPEPQPVKVTSLTTSTGNLTLEVGQSSKMSVTVNPSNADNKSVTFSSSNSGVATVDGSGNIVAKAAGTTYITAKSSENGNINVSIVVTVNEKPKPQPTYTGSTILNRVVNELGWCKVSGYSQAFIGKTGCDSIAGNRYVEMSSLNGSQGIDVAINIYDSSATGVVSGVEAIIRWMMPSSGQQIINKLHDPNFYGGTFENMDGRKVVVSLRSFGIAIDIYPKY